MSPVAPKREMGIAQLRKFSSRHAPIFPIPRVGRKCVRQVRGGLLLLLLVTSTIASAEDDPPDTMHPHRSANAKQSRALFPTVVRRVASDRLREGLDGMLGVEVIFDVDAEPAAVLDILWNVKRFKETFPDIHAVDVLERKENELVTRVKVDAVLATVEYTTRRTFDPLAKRVSWVELGGDLERVRGSWTVTPVAGGTQSHVHYRSFVVVSAWVPESVYRELVFQKVHEMVERVRRGAKKAN